MQRRPGRQPRRSVLARLLPEPLRGEPARHDHRPPASQRGERRRDQAVDMEQRHHAERDVRRREPVVRGDGSGRCHQVALAQRHLLRPGCRSARVQDDSHVVGLAGLEAGRLRKLLIVNQEHGRPVTASPRGQDRHRAFPGSAARRGGPARRHHEHPRRDIGQVEDVLAVRIGRVERCGGSAERGNREQDLDHVGAIGQRDRYPVTAPDAGRGQGSRQARHPVSDLPVGQDLAILGNHQRRAIGVIEDRGQHLARVLLQHRPSSSVWL